jgi:hypothetical protein
MLKVHVMKMMHHLQLSYRESENWTQTLTEMIVRAVEQGLPKTLQAAVGHIEMLELRRENLLHDIRQRNEHSLSFWLTD